MSEQTTTRRSVLTSAAAVATAGVLCAAPAAAQADADAELLRLGAQIDAMFPAMFKRRYAVVAALKAADEEIIRRLGYALSDEMPRDRRQRWLSELRRVEAEMGIDAGLEEIETDWERYGEVHEAIRALPATTAAGLAVKARAVAIVLASKLFDRPSEALDYDHLLVLELIEAIHATAGARQAIRQLSLEAAQVTELEAT